MKRQAFLFLAAGVLLAIGEAPAHSAGLIRSIWSCSIPCLSTQNAKGDPVAFLQVSYCATTVLTPEMFENLTPLCQSKTGRSDVVAARSAPANVAECVSSSNACEKEGLTLAGFSCHYTCPSQGRGIRKFTACAKTGDEAFANAKQLCPDAAPPDDSFFAQAHTCTAEGQTACE